MRTLTINTKSVLETKGFQYSELSFFIAGPIILVQTDLIPFTALGIFNLLITFSLLALFLTILRVKLGIWTTAQVGLTLQDFRKALVLYGIIFIVFSLFLVISPMVTKTRSGFDPEYFLKFSFAGAILQEILCRSYLFNLIKDLSNKKKSVYISINILIFTGMHIIFPNFFSVSAPFVLIAGFIFTMSWDRYPNIILITMIHMVTNYLAYNIYIF